MITELDHINVETTDLERSVTFYTRILGLTKGWRPGFDVPGAWMYCGDQPIVHIVDRGPNDRSKDTYPIHHVAVKARDLNAYRQRLQAENIKHVETVVPDLNVTQIFIDDPDGVKIELNFYDAEQN